MESVPVLMTVCALPSSLPCVELMGTLTPMLVLLAVRGWRWSVRGSVPAPRLALIGTDWHFNTVSFYLYYAFISVRGS